MVRALFGAGVLFSLNAWAQAPIGEIWPHQLKVTTGGVVEYAYDLRALKKAGATVDANAAHGEAEVMKFLKGLPDTATVRLKPGAPLSLAGAGGLEEAPLSPSFGAVSTAKLVTEDPLGRTAAGRLTPALHPDEPKVLLSADAVLWRVRQFEDGVAAALEAELDRSRTDLLTRVFAKAVDRAAHTQGDASEGARALAARLAVALSCLDSGKFPAAAKSGELNALAKAELERLALPPEAAVPPHAYDWTPELVCSHVRIWVLKQPFAATRAGAAAPLTLLALVDGDPKLKAQWDTLRARRDVFFGKPTEEPLQAWREKAKPTALEAIDDLGGFLVSLGSGLPTPPGLWDPAQTPIRRFLDEMKGAERGNAIEELFAAAQDGRLGAAAPADGAWGQFREAAWGALASGDVASKDRQLDADWRDRLAGLFFALFSAHHESRGGDRDRPEPPVRSELLVKLKVPPFLDVEPLPLAYARGADSLDRLGALLTAQKLTALRPLGPSASATTGGAGQEAARLSKLLRGLAWLADPKPVDEPPEALVARKFIAGWRADPVLTRDAREVFAGAVTTGESRPHVAVAGIGRRPVGVSFSSAPRAELAAKVEGVEVDTSAEQVYLVPVLVTVGGQAPAGALPLAEARWRKLVDGVGKKRVAAEGEFLEAVGGAK